MTTPQDLWVSYKRIFFVELAYWVVSISMVFVNEFVLSANILSDDLTIFITMFQILFSLGILITLNHITKTYLMPPPDRNLMVKLKDPNSVSVSTKLIDSDELADDFNIESKELETKVYNQDSLVNLFIVNIPRRINLETLKVVFPLSTLYIGMLLLNNFCLKYVGVAFYFVSRSLTTVFNVIFTYILINEPVSRGALLCCVFIVLGFMLGIDQESLVGSLSVTGVIFGVMSSLFTSLFSIYTKKTLAKLDRNIWVLVLYNNISAILLCTPLLVVHGDVQALISDKVISPIFWLLLSISGVMSFFISIVTNASIKYTSPLTHNISGTAKACFQTVIAVLYRHDHKSTLWWVSNVMILLASTVYSRIKQLEMESKSNCLSEVSGRGQDDSSSSKRRLYRRDSESSESSETCSDIQSDEQRRASCSVNIKAVAI